MADPMSWMMIASAGAAGMQAIGSIQAGQAQAGAARFNQQVALQNAQIADAQGHAAAVAQQRSAQQKMGSALAAYGASGVQTGSGSPVDVLSQSAREATLDNLTVKYNAKLKKMGFEQQAELFDASAHNASTSGYMNAASSLLSGAGRLAYGWSGLRDDATKTPTNSTGFRIPNPFNLFSN